MEQRMSQRPETLPDLLADAGLRLKRLTPGHSEKLQCPRCGGGKTREKSLSVTVDEDGAGAVFQCHRGTCGWQGGGRVGSASGIERERPVARPEPHTAAQKENRPEWFYRWFADRRIGAKTISDLGIYATTRWFPDPVGEGPAVVFPYVWRGDVVNRKYRPHPAKNPMLQERDALPTLFNIDALGDAPEEIVWVEGEMDVAALWECGVHHVVTLKDGAPAKVGQGDSNKRFEALRTHADVLSKAKRIVLAGDTDAPGLALREELARRLGRHRCRIAEWPRGCKDAGDTLVEHGPDGVLGILAASEPYPIEGLQSTFGGRLLALRDQPPPATMSTGTDASDEQFKLPAEGRLIVVTGWPSSGKTAWLRFIMVHTARHHNRRWCVFSPEMQPWEQFIAMCAEVVAGKPFWPVSGRERMSVPEVMRAEAWLTDRVVMMVNDSEDEPPTLDWIFDHARLAILRDGITDVLIDPWNEIDHQRGSMSETDYIGRALQRTKSFCLRHGCNAWIIAHPAKPMQLRPGEARGPAGPYDISGSANWVNKADFGVTVHALDGGKSHVGVWKSRFRRWALRGAAVVLDYDDMTGRYSSPGEGI